MMGRIVNVVLDEALCIGTVFAQFIILRSVSIVPKFILFSLDSFSRCRGSSDTPRSSPLLVFGIVAAASVRGRLTSGDEHCGFVLTAFGHVSPSKLTGLGTDDPPSSRWSSSASKSNRTRSSLNGHMYLLVTLP